MGERLMDEEYKSLIERLILAKLESELVKTDDINIIKLYVKKQAKKLDRKLEKLEKAK
jgi:hypothetical protein